MVEKPLNDYELVMVVSPEADEDRVAGLVDRVTGYVTEHGGSISNQENWGVRRLAYPIQRFQEGNYTLTQFVLDPERVRELDRTLVASEDVLRHLVSKIDKPEPKKEQPPVATEQPPEPETEQTPEPTEEPSEPTEQSPEPEEEPSEPEEQPSEPKKEQPPEPTEKASSDSDP